MIVDNDFDIMFLLLAMVTITSVIVRAVFHRDEVFFFTNISFIRFLSYYIDRYSDAYLQMLTIVKYDI